MSLHYLVKLIAQVLLRYITNTPCFVTKSHVPHTGNIDLLMLFCSVSLFAVSFTQNAL